MTETTARADQRLVNGVFQGGGAKGVAYVGALQAVQERGVWFGSVAGTSAGAITASLVAAGFEPDELTTLIPDALGAAHAPLAPRLGLAVLGKSTSVLEGDGLRRWLNQTYARRLGLPDDHLVTFDELYNAAGVELYVVALDLAEQLPMVFSRRTSPGVEVAGAVVASSAIPSIFPPGRAVFEVGGSSTRVHQLVDGMVWANYPAFVFEDDAFRNFLRGEAEIERDWTDADDTAWDEEQERPVLGFVFGEPEPLEHRSPVGFVPLDGAPVDRRFDLGPTYTSRGKISYLIGSLLSSDWARLFVGLALAIWVSLSVATLPLAFRRFSTWLASWLPEVVYPAVLVGLLTVVVMALVAIIVLIGFLMMISRLLADTMLPILDSVIGIPREVPPWLGLGPDSVVIRVPREGLKAAKFDVDEETRDRAVANARAGVGEQLEGESGRRLESLFAGVRPELPPYRRGERPLEPEEPATTSPAWVVAILVGATAVVGALTWWATNSAATEGIWLIVLAVAGAIIATGLAFRYIADLTRRRASRRATLGPTGARPWLPHGVVALTGAALVVAGLVVSFVAMDRRSDDTIRAEVISAVEVGDGNEYVVDPIGVDDPNMEVRSDRHLRLGESVFVERDGGDPLTGDLVGALDDAWFAVAVVLLALGVGAITAAERNRRWAKRCRRLDELTAAWNEREVPA